MFNKNTIIKEVKEFCNDKKVSINSMVVTAGAAMCLLGYKDTTNDIDIEVSDEVFTLLLSKYPETLHVYQSEPRSNGEVEYIDELKFSTGNGDITVTPVITGCLHTDFTSGIRHRTVESIIYLKRFLGRPKDLEDIKKLEDYAK